MKEEKFLKILSNIEKRLERIERILEANLGLADSQELFPPPPGPRIPRIYLSTPLLTPAEKEVLRIIDERGEVTAELLAQQLGISRSSATRYLRGLHRLGFIKRRERRGRRGREAVYYR